MQRVSRRTFAAIIAELAPHAPGLAQQIMAKLGGRRVPVPSPRRMRDERIVRAIDANQPYRHIADAVGVSPSAVNRAGKRTV